MQTICENLAANAYTIAAACLHVQCTLLIYTAFGCDSEVHISEACL